MTITPGGCEGADCPTAAGSACLGPECTMAATVSQALQGSGVKTAFSSLLGLFAGALAVLI